MPQAKANIGSIFSSETRYGYADYPIVKRDQASTHVKTPSGFAALISASPQNYRVGGEWTPIPDTLEVDAAKDSIAMRGVGATLARNGHVKIGAHSHLTETVGGMTKGIYRPVQSLLKPGIIEANELIRQADIYRHIISVTPSMVKELLILSDAPPVSDDYFAVETAIQDKLITAGPFRHGEYGELRFHPAYVRDSAWNSIQASRVVLADGHQKKMYTLIPTEWLAAASFPVYIDPTSEFVGSSTDIVVWGKNSSYSSARSTQTGGESGGETARVGQIHRDEEGGYFICYRVGYIFNTSSLASDMTILQVNLDAVATGNASSPDFNVQITKAAWTGINDSSYDLIRTSTVDNTWRSTSGLSTNTVYTSSDLDTSYIDIDGNTKYGIVSSRDIAGNSPSSSGEQNEYVQMAMANHGTAAYRPTLVVQYSRGAPQVILVM